jgi:hypothetical protein
MEREVLWSDSRTLVLRRIVLFQSSGYCLLEREVLWSGGRTLVFRRIVLFQSSGYCLLAREVLWSGIRTLAFRRIIPPQSSGLKNKLHNQQQLRLQLDLIFITISTYNLAGL